MSLKPFTITPERLLELGFTNEGFGWERGSVCVSDWNTDKEWKVLVANGICGDYDYHGKALGVRTEVDLLELLRLVNGE
jgi:hypothetical protein